MRTSIVSILAAASVVSAQSSTVVPAPQATGEPLGASYTATLPQKNGSTVAGSIVGTTAANGVGTTFAVSFSGLPATGGPFIYHIHQYAVPTNGNCTGTGAHLDPYMRGETPACDATQPQTCQVGDLSGKWGSVAGPSFSAQYTDPYVSTLPSSNAFFGNLSFVIHFANKTRIACANFTSTGSSYSASSMSGSKPTSVMSMAPGAPSYTGAPPAMFTGGAAKVLGSTGAALAAAAAAALML